MALFDTAVLTAAGILHLLPVAGMAGRMRLRRLYGIDLSDADTLLLMRHRAAMFAALGLLLLAAAAVPQWRLPGAVAGLISTAAYCGLAGRPGSLSPPLRRLWWIDLILALGLAAVAMRAVSGGA
ncbi:MAG: hypothetical protein PHP86_00645 [Nevskiales bacterium]|nr:hypothetical protein [Nevskiales bacterium]